MTARVPPLRLLSSRSAPSRKAATLVVGFIQRGEKLLKDTAEALRARGLSVATILIEGGTERVSRFIVEQARLREADLIVLGTHGRRGFSRLMMGSDAEQVVRTSPVPVMLVRLKSSTGEIKAPGSAQAVTVA